MCVFFTSIGLIWKNVQHKARMLGLWVADTQSRKNPCSKKLPEAWNRWFRLISYLNSRFLHHVCCTDMDDSATDCSRCKRFVKAASFTRCYVCTGLFIRRWRSGAFSPGGKKFKYHESITMLSGSFPKWIWLLTLWWPQLLFSQVAHVVCWFHTESLMHLAQHHFNR